MEFDFERSAVAQGRVRALGVVALVEVVGWCQARFCQVGAAGPAEQEPGFKHPPDVRRQGVGVGGRTGSGWQCPASGQEGW